MTCRNEIRCPRDPRLTVDGEGGRRLGLAHHVLRHTSVGANVSRGETADLQGVVVTDLITETGDMIT